MSEHDIADCPECGKRDLILKEDGEWMCLNPECKYHKKGFKMPTSESDADSNPDLLSILIAALIAVMFVLVALGV